MITARSVWKEFREGGQTCAVLRDVNVTVATGELVAIVGPSGSGKSTLMNIIGLLDRPTRGEIWLGGIPIGTLKATELADLRAQKIGFVFQSFHLLPQISVLENVALPLIYRGERKASRLEKARKLLNQLGLDAHAEMKPGQLSGGQRQRAAIARALIGTPSLLLADEPTGNLDSATANQVLALFSQLNVSLGLTILLVTHDMSIADRCDRCITLRDGLVMEQGQHHLRSVTNL